MDVENPSDFSQEANQAHRRAALGCIQERPIDVFLLVSLYALCMAFHSLFSPETVKHQPQICAGHYLVVRGAGGLVVRGAGGLVVRSAGRFEFRTSCSSGGREEDCAVHSCISAVGPRLCTAHGTHLAKPHIGEENKSHMGCMWGAVLAPHEPLFSAHLS